MEKNCRPNPVLATCTRAYVDDVCLAMFALSAGFKVSRLAIELPRRSNSLGKKCRRNYRPVPCLALIVSRHFLFWKLLSMEKLCGLALLERSGSGLPAWCVLFLPTVPYY